MTLLMDPNCPGPVAHDPTHGSPAHQRTASARVDEEERIIFFAEADDDEIKHEPHRFVRRGGSSPRRRGRSRVRSPPEALDLRRRREWRRQARLPLPEAAGSRVFGFGRPWKSFASCRLAARTAKEKRFERDARLRGSFSSK